LEWQLYAQAHINIMFFDAHRSNKNEMHLAVKDAIKKPDRSGFFVAGGLCQEKNSINQ